MSVDAETEASESGGARGRIGVEIYEQVERLIAEHGITRSEAFARLSEETGRRAGTVAANYYRIARQRGAGRPRRGGPGRPPGRARGGRRRGVSGDAQGVLNQAQQALEQLTALVRRQEAELAELRDQTEQLQELRKWMSKNVR